MRTRFLVIPALFLLATAGFGCSGEYWPFGNTTSTGGFISSTSTAVEAAEAIQFIPGDTFEVRQTVFGFGAFLPDLLKTDEGIRYVTVLRFAPTHVAELQWNVIATRETDASKRARARYERDLEENPRGIGESVIPPPNVVTERVTTTGTLLGINLRTSHTALLPVYWKEGRYDVVGERTAIWLSDDAFLELVKTRRTILNLGIFDEAVNQAAKNITGLKDAYARLRNTAAEEGKFKDLTQLEADPEFIEWPLDVNGERRIVSAIRARNWFGEVIVLNNRQNPMILKVTLNPAAVATDAINGEGDVVEKLFGYEVKNIRLNRP